MVDSTNATDVRGGAWQAQSSDCSGATAGGLLLGGIAAGAGAPAAGLGRATRRASASVVTGPTRAGGRPALES